MAQSPKRKPTASNPPSKKIPSKPKQGYSAFSLVITALVIMSGLLGLNLFATKASVQAIVIAPSPDPSSRFVFQPLQPIATVSGYELKAVSDITPRYRVGVVSGHKGYDSGAVCPDGMTEAHLNYVVATEVVDLLMRRGVLADLLDEFDERLTDYEADALVSIHADSCTVPGATGFKAARITDSAIPEAEDALVECLNAEYARYTGLPQHPASITDDMTNYHAFREIDHHTPGAIIEMGFMLEDRFLLEYKPKILARGIASGVLCFLSE